VLDTIAFTLDYSHLAQLPLDEKRHQVAKRLQEKSCLLVVDNFETITDQGLYDFLQALPEPSKCLVTSRTQNLKQARAISIRGLAKAEAQQLIQNEASRLGLNLTPLVADERNFSRFYEATGGAPLAIRWSIGQIKQRGQTLEGVLNSLHGAQGDIFEFIFQRAWSLLTDPARNILLLMPIFAYSASRPAIEAASEVHKWDLDEGLGQLVELWLLEASDHLEESKRRYSLHPLTRAFAQSKLAQQPELERSARVRLAEFFTELAKAAGGDRWGQWERYDEIEEEEENIFALLEWCFENGEAREGIQLTKAVVFFIIQRWYYY
jgi:LuxR family glucitol operon transcriptional activator